MLNVEYLKPNYIVDDAGEKNAVILPLDQFYRLLEDLEDLAIVAERRDEPTVSHTRVLEELKAEGLVGTMPIGDICLPHM